MKTTEPKSVFPLGFYTSMAVLCISFLLNAPALAVTIPEDLIIEEPYAPGVGLPVGRTLSVQGEAIVVHHHDTKRGYMAKAGLSLFNRDILLTKKGGRMQFRLNDGSVMTLASGTELVITKSLYDEKKGARSSFLGLGVGKARFVVRKLFEFRRSRFRVRTPTAIVGVRGSDFVIFTSEQLTNITALEETSLEVVSSDFPDEEPVPVNDFEQVTVEEGALPSDVTPVSPEDVEKLLEDLVMPEDDKAGGGEGGEGGSGPGGGGILVSGDDIVGPEGPSGPEDFEGGDFLDTAERDQGSQQEGDIGDGAMEIFEDIMEGSSRDRAGQDQGSGTTGTDVITNGDDYMDSLRDL